MLSLILLRLTLEEVVADIPRDAEAILVYGVLALFIAFIWAGSRGNGSAGSSPTEEHHDR